MNKISDASFTHSIDQRYKILINDNTEEQKHALSHAAGENIIQGENAGVSQSDNTIIFQKSYPMIQQFYYSVHMSKELCRGMLTEHH